MKTSNHQPIQPQISNELLAFRDKAKLLVDNSKASILSHSLTYNVASRLPAYVNASLPDGWKNNEALIPLEGSVVLYQTSISLAKRKIPAQIIFDTSESENRQLLNRQLFSPDLSDDDKKAMTDEIQSKQGQIDQILRNNKQAIAEILEMPALTPAQETQEMQTIVNELVGKHSPWQINTAKQLHARSILLTSAILLNARDEQVAAISARPHETVKQNIKYSLMLKKVIGILQKDFEQFQELRKLSDSSSSSSSSSTYDTKLEPFEVQTKKAIISQQLGLK